MASNDERVLSFMATWFDPQPQLEKRFLLKYFPHSHEIEMKDAFSGRKFLKRTKIDSVTTSNTHLSEVHFFIGATIIFLSRDLKLVDYGDDATRTLLGPTMETTIVILTPAAYDELGCLINTIESSGFILNGAKSIVIPDKVLDETADLLGIACSSIHIRESGGADFVILSFRGLNAVAKVNEVVMNIETELKKQRCVACSKTREEATVFSDLFLKHQHKTTAILGAKNCTCCVIKPHVIKARATGQIIHDIISRGYHVTSIGLFHLDRSSAAEFYEVYEGVLSEFDRMVDELCSGSIVAMEVRANPEEFRMTVGPWDVEVANKLFPDTLRSRYGSNRIQNAIHSTDLPRDVAYELDYFFAFSCLKEKMIYNLSQ